MYQTNESKLLENDGVVLIEDCFRTEEMQNLKLEYNQFNETLDSTEIPKNEPIVVFWTHKEGEQKRILPLNSFSSMKTLIEKSIVPTLREKLGEKAKRLQLLETIIFNKPSTKTNTLHWHQDVAYFPLKPNNQLAVWFPLEIVTEERGAMGYALGSHKLGARGSINLHTRQVFDNEERPLIPDDPREEGLETKIFEMSPRDMLVHDGYTWHYSGPNSVKNHNRKGVSVRFITDEAVFDPRPGQGAAFTKQIEINKGDTLVSEAFPIL